MGSRHFVPWLILAFVALFGAALWHYGEDAKVTELGTALLGSAVVGAALVFVERGLSARSNALQRTISMVPAAAEPLRDVPPPSDGEATLEPSVDQPEPAKPPRRFRVEYDGWRRDTSRVDVHQARLRVFADDEYFQFFTAVLSGLDVLIWEDSTSVTKASFRRAFVDLAVEEIRARIESGDAPLADPSLAIEVRPDAKMASRRARREGGDAYVEREVVADFEL